LDGRRADEDITVFDSKGPPSRFSQ
jgi:hypothetical protein